MEREKIKEIVIDTSVYDTELPQKAVQALSGEIPELEPNERLGLDVIFSKAAYSQAGFFRYELTQEHKGPAPKTDREKIKQKIYDILNEQLDKVVSALKELGCVFGNTGIIGDDLEEDKVLIVLYRQQAAAFGKGKRTVEASVRCIMPDRPFIFKQAGELMAKLFLEQKNRENAIEIAKKNHTPHWVSAGELFAAVSGTLAGETEDAVPADKLIDTAYMDSDWPLHMRTRSRADQAEPMTGGTQIDCPEYIVFQLNQGGQWELKKADGLKEAQHVIVKQGFNYKRTKAVVVLKDLKKVPYTLFAETDDGLIAVAPCEANAYKKLHVSWQKAR